MTTEPYRWHYDYTRIAWDMGFHFNSQKTSQTYDRNGIALLDIERIIRETDIGIVDHHIQSILEYKLDPDEAKILDPNFVKLFRLSQLGVEYLLYCKRYLDTTITTLKTDLQKSMTENDDLKADVKFYQNEVHKLKKKAKDLKDILHVVQRYHPASLKGTFRCYDCKKTFQSTYYLKLHIERRHPNSEQKVIDDDMVNNGVINTTPVHSLYKAETDRLQMEIKELKEKLNNTERYDEFQHVENKTIFNNNQKHQGDYYKHIENLHDQFQQLKTQIEGEIQVIKESKNEQEHLKAVVEKSVQTVSQSKANESIQVNIIPETKAVEGKPTVEHKEIQAEINLESLKQTNEVNETDKDNVDHEQQLTSPPKRNKSPIKHSIIMSTKTKERTPKIINVTESPTRRPQSPIHVLESPKKYPTNNLDLTKVKEEMGKELEERTKQNIEKFGEQLNEKMSNTFGKLQERLELFWNKLQEIEVEKANQSVYKIENEKEIQVIPVAAKRKPQITVKSKNVAQHVESEYSEEDSGTESSQHEEPIAKKPIISVHDNNQRTKNLIAEIKSTLKEKNAAQNQKPTSVQNKPVVVEILKAKSVLSKSSPNEPESSSEDSEESDSEEESNTSEDTSEATSLIAQPSKSEIDKTYVAKSINTGVSTLENRSIRSMENALHNNPNVLKSFRRDIKHVLSERLTQLGVDPEWNKLPEKTYQEKIEILGHERNMTARKNRTFLEIRNSILEDLASKIKVTQRIESPIKTPDSTNRASRFKSLFVNIKDKAKSMIKSDKSPTPTKGVYKLSVYKDLPPKPDIKESSPQPIDNKKMGRVRHLPVQKQVKTRQKNAKITATPVMYETDSEEDNSEEVQSTIAESEIPDKIVYPNKNVMNRSRSESSMEVVELSDEYSPKNRKKRENKNKHPVPAARSLDSILEMKQELKSQLNKSSDMEYSLEAGDSKSAEIISISPKKRSYSGDLSDTKLENISSNDSDEYVEEKVQKGVLKNSPGAGGVKKKVLFDLHSDKIDKSNFEKLPEHHEAKIIPVKKTIVQSSAVYQNNSEWNDSSSIDSSIFDKRGSKTSLTGKTDQISTKAVINVTGKQKNVHDDISDWDISDVN